MYKCQTCGMTVDCKTYHPFIYCELYKLGHTDPANYIRKALMGAVVLLPFEPGQNLNDGYEVVRRTEVASR